MLIAIPAESLSGEKRVAGTPDMVKKLVALGYQLVVEGGAGMSAGISDEAYRAAGATVGSKGAVWQADVVLKVRPPTINEIAHLKPKALLVGMLEPHHREGLLALAERGVSAFALEAMPRTTRAQSMDVLSSQANLSGYKAVIMAADAFPRLFPMQMTAAGTIKAARVVVLGAGVAGLQAIATAKRLGAVVEASDARPSVKEQVESLGAKFIDVPYENEEEKAAAEGVKGYARAMPASWLERQQAEVAKRIAQADVVITTALIAGRAAPTLVTAEMVVAMKPHAVIVDMAAGRAADGVAGNCVLTEAGKRVVKHGVTLIGETNLPALVAVDASALYARNVFDFLKLILKSGGEGLQIDLEDDIVAACLVVHNGTLIEK